MFISNRFHNWRQQVKNQQNYSLKNECSELTLKLKKMTEVSKNFLEEFNLLIETNNAQVNQY